MNTITTSLTNDHFIIPANNSKGYDIAEEEEDSINFSNPNSETRRGRVGKGVAQTLDTSCNQGVLVKNDAYILGYTRDKKGKVTKRNPLNHSNTIHTSTGSGGNTDQFAICNQRIRRLTPKECFALMDFNEDFKWDVSDSQAYKQAGNSIVVACLVEIIKRLDLSKA